ncbi:unnamed protein product [Musa acuminata subsp. burmannicoides]
MGVKQCELCDRPARMHCESDQASLCWECDAKVHGANFLVARHSRCLLCQSCQSPTPWRAEGARPGYATSTCERCAAGCATDGRKDGGADAGPGGVGVAAEDEGEMGGEEADEDEDEEAEEPEDDGVDEEGENQVVPWSMTPPPVSSSSSSEEEQEAGRRERGGGFLKRTRVNVNLPLSQEDVACSSSQPSYMTSDDATSRDRKRPNPLRADTDTSALGDVRFHGNQGGLSSSHPGIAEQSKKQQG